MLIFWVVAGVLAAAAAGLILFRAAAVGSEAAPGADPAPQLYRRQLAEIDELADRGLIAEGERKSAHAEAARRLLAAADAPAQAWSADPKSRAGVLAAGVAAPALGLGLYLALGSPGMGDQPYERRVAAWRTGPLEQLTPPQIAAVLRQVTAERPRDAEGLRLLALAEAASEDYPGAVRALRRAVQLAPERADLWRTLGEGLVFQAGGKVDAAAQAAFEETLRREPGDVAARFYLAQAKADAGRGAQAAAEFQALLAQLPAGDERRPMVEAALAKAQGRQTPRMDSGQMAMIQGMVQGLAARLAQKPDDPEGWVRLVRAYAVLGDTAKRDEAYASARARYAGQPKVLQDLDVAARAEPMR
jgi:cytochrome c-type biogenesis protein CcmH